WKLGRDYSERVIPMAEKANDLWTLAGAFNNLAEIHFQLGDQNSATEALTQAMQYGRKVGNPVTLAFTQNMWGKVLLAQGKAAAARDSLLQAQALLQRAPARDQEAIAHYLLGRAEIVLNNPETADRELRTAWALRDTLMQEATAENVQRMQTIFEVNELERQNAALEAARLLEEARSSRQQVMLWGAGGILVLMLALGTVIWLSYRRQKAARKIIEQQHKELQVANTEITDSIHYAGRIQAATLPSEATLKALLPDAQVFFQPRGEVSGDFYWVGESEEGVLLAVADCTGHGVPGALMSMVGATLLHEIVQEKGITSPAAMLAALESGLAQTMRKNGDGEERLEGMDISIARFSPEQQQVTFAGANSHAYLVRNGKAELIEGAVHAIGGVDFGVEKTWEEVVLKVGDKDRLVLLTDGFEDQFGGEDGGKFGSRRMKEMLEMQDLDAGVLASRFANWRAEGPQTDDVLVLGIFNPS
ncbi:MAG: SpoIIE family protein phosphatase, partial [Bacteroidota bacterium]